MKNRLLVPNNNIAVIKLRTLTTADKYLCDIDRLVGEVFPRGLGISKRCEQWQRVVEVTGPQGIKDPELWRHIQQFRRKTGQRRQVRDKVVTTAFVDFIVDQLQTETSAFGDFKYHDSGTGTGDEAAANTALGTPCGDARDTGTQTETDHDTYKSVATHTYDEALAITEHGLFNASSDGTLMDRTKFAAINVVNGNQIEFTFEISFTAGG